MLLPPRPELKESRRREAGLLGTLALKRQKMNIWPEQDSNPQPSACESSDLLLRHLAFHNNDILEVVFNVKGRGKRSKAENPQKTPLPLME